MGHDIWGNLWEAKTSKDAWGLAFLSFSNCQS